jgi:hypothetical protein
MLKRWQNLLRTGWSFDVVAFYADCGAAHVGDLVTLSATVRNNGTRIGTAYVRFLVADSYDAAHPIFNSDRDLSENERRALRVVDIARGGEYAITCVFRVPEGAAHRHFDLRVQVWNPHRLFRGAYPWKFADTGWRGMFEVIARPSLAAADRVFISYSWDSESHRDWVRQLAEELERHDIYAMTDQRDLRAGEDITLFMERAISESKVTLLVCSERYTTKANARGAGGVGFETVLSAHEYMHRSPDERARLIPIVRNNSLPTQHKLPRYLGSALYVEMSGANWRGKPMADLITAIRRHIKLR